MATLRVKLRPSSRQGGEGALFFQIIHQRCTRQVNTGYKLYPEEWDLSKSCVIVPVRIDDYRYDYLQKLNIQLHEETARLRSIIVKFDREGVHYTTDDIVNEFHDIKDYSGFLAFADEVIKQKMKSGHQRTATEYLTAVNNLRKFLSDRPDIPLEGVDSSLIEEFESWLKANGLCPNSTSAYMRCLRAIFNKAVEQGLTWQRNPFRLVYTGVDKTKKRALHPRTIAQIRDYDLALYPNEDLARDIFMFCFFTRGMSLIDVAFLQKSDLQDGYFIYTRQKTGQKIRVTWKPQMQAIVDKYKNETKDSAFLLPLINGQEKDRRQYDNAQHRINRYLKKLAKLIGLSEDLTTYVARHSWASSAQYNSVPIGTISQAMGHDSEHTTRIYLADLDTSDIDEANDKVIDSLDS